MSKCMTEDGSSVTFFYVSVWTPVLQTTLSSHCNKTKKKTNDKKTENTRTFKIKNKIIASRGRHISLGEQWGLIWKNMTEYIWLNMIWGEKIQLRFSYFSLIHGYKVMLSQHTHQSHSCFKLSSNLWSSESQVLKTAVPSVSTWGRLPHIAWFICITLQFWRNWSYHFV